MGQRAIVSNIRNNCSLTRIIDALTSTRPYKQAWSNEAAIDELRKLAGETLDRDCVDALIQNLDEVERIQQRFREDFYG